ncbi:GNAT family N-acetyltransferase [Sphingomonas sp. M1-B02]|uniref:GNAT family N-acetyltransferase n=1 Tax=Sphingomonas sp. M1-B02 TaxID=3114300 RepID=UPI00223F1BDA|nr:GNAT family N-acetyltransferase [Sphingomonas sp. S6-11]UZK65177.1 GNAT family N-acetyltransferase [Sphingomonas sp. S6-11]
MELQPTLEGELVRIRPTVPEDWDALFAVAADPLIWEVHPANDRWQEPVFRRYFEDALASGGGVTIVDKASDAVIGASRYAFPDAARDEVEIGWTFIARAYWGGSYNREIKRLMLDHIHRFVGGAIFVVGKDNIRSRRAMEKIGGVLQKGRTERGDGSTPPDHVYYLIRRP